ncbi:ABC transporter substrate-binding protein [Roseomonas haemaphysalidis]|uniref:ABC transporter substrate-binding protein n=1 Tax=Roseomonas haemaphysalidis TaxID=2768162 RepID=A0ABS3KMX0_9PROT|nr:ABC transporter substrate-binding protein [Roseomonas haemaphysalidis]MBO1078392.1 ABC transporter substrate-binding protein [Roseomonas haemaphysalidis]
MARNWTMAAGALVFGLVGGAQAQTLTMAVQSTFGIDPHFFFNGPNMAAARHIYDTVISRDADSRQVPGAVQSWQAVEPTVWELKLRPGVTFHDGTPFTAEDIAFSIARIPNIPGNIGPYTINLRTISRVEIVDPLTVRLHTSEPNPVIPGQLTNVFIVSKRVAENATTADFNAGRAAIGTGPYRVSGGVTPSGLQLRRSGNYYGEQPAWTEVNLRIVPNDAARLAGLLAGDFDLIEDVPNGDIARLRREGRVNVASRPTDRIMYLSVNVAPDPLPLVTGADGHPLPVNPLSDVRVRRALSMAIDRKALAERTMEGMAVAAGQLTPEGFLGHDPAVGIPAADAAGARRLLAEAGYPDGFGLTVSCSNDRYVNDARVCQAIGQMLSRAGLKMTVDVTPSTVFFPRIRPDRVLLPLHLVGRSFSSGDASYVLSTSFHTRDVPANLGGANRNGFSVPEIDRRIREVMVRMDDGRGAALQGLMHDVEQLAPQIPLYVQMSAIGTRKGITYTPRLDEQVVAAQARPTAP